MSSLARAAIDISDGLHADLSHVLRVSGCGACIYIDQLPASKAVLGEPIDIRRALQIADGDDFELCFTGNDDQLQSLRTEADGCGLAITEIGVIEKSTGLRCKVSDGTAYLPAKSGFDHFRV
ncbi:MAG: hypothetical protein V3U84_07610 [Thiotrichaceae bacterium]